MLLLLQQKNERQFQVCTFVWAEALEHALEALLDDCVRHLTLAYTSAKAYGSAMMLSGLARPS